MGGGRKLLVFSVMGLGVGDRGILGEEGNGGEVGAVGSSNSHFDPHPVQDDQ